MTDRPAGRERLALAAVLAVAALLRLGFWLPLADAPFVGQPVLDSQEYHRWGERIAAGNWGGEGAFFQAPLYPYLLGAVYSLAGPRPGAVYLLQILAALGALWALWRAGRALEGPAVGLAAAALAAASGILVLHDAQLLKESLAASLVALLLLALVKAREAAAPAARWAAAGLCLGLLAGLRENALLLVPVLAALAWLPVGGQGPTARAGRPAARRRFAATLALLGGLLLAMAPIALRNLIVAGQPLVTTFQGGVNLYIGNNPRADGTYRPLVPGRQIPALERREAQRLAEEAAGRALSPREVSGHWTGRAVAWATSEPAAFARLQVRKVGLFWSLYEWPDAVDYYWLRERSPALRLALVERGALCGLAAAGVLLLARRRRLLAWAPVLAVLLGWMVATVAFFLFSRYRLPAVPPLALLAAVPLAEAWRLLRAGRRGAAGLGAVAIALVLAAPHLLAPGPRLDLVHVNLGRLALERGDARAAAAEFESALAASPGDLTALLELGNLAARDGRHEEALALYRRAARAEPASPEALANLGGALLATRDRAGAEAALRRALALDRGQLAAAHNLALLLSLDGRREEATEWNRRVLAAAPDHSAARRLRARLESEPADGSPRRR